MNPLDEFCVPKNVLLIIANSESYFLLHFHFQPLLFKQIGECFDQSFELNLRYGFVPICIQITENIVDVAVFRKGGSCHFSEEYQNLPELKFRYSSISIVIMLLVQHLQQLGRGQFNQHVWFFFACFLCFQLLFSVHLYIIFESELNLPAVFEDWKIKK